MHVFVVQHIHEFDDESEDVKFIGVYSTQEKACAAVARLSKQPGFRDAIEGFHVDQCLVDQDGWAEGYVTISRGQE